MFSKGQCLFHLSEWSDFYIDPPKGNDVKQMMNETGKTDLSSYENAYVHDCTFKKISGSGNGGVIYYSKNSKLLVELCSFNTCSSSYDGGAIYFNAEGQCVLSSVCGVKCNTGSGRSGQFCLVFVSKGPQYKNQIIDSSVILTNAKSYYQFSPLYHFRGNASVKGVNVSNNEVGEISGIHINNPSISSISFSSFRRNNATSYTCIKCSTGSNKHYITNTNIIENEQQTTTSSNGIIHANYASISMTQCSIFGNKPGSGVVLFGTITCINCSVTNDQETYTTGSVTFTEKPSKLVINYYEFLNLEECKPGLDEWSNIKPITPSKDRNICSKCFCEELIHRGDINLYRLLEYMCLLCCLHPDPAKDIWYDIQ